MHRRHLQGHARLGGVHELSGQLLLRAHRAAVERDVHTVLRELGVSGGQREHGRVQLCRGVRVLVRGNVEIISIYECIE